MLRAAVVAIALAALTPHLAYADSVDVAGLTTLIEKQPADMDRSVWKEKRRDAARKLGQSKDKRAVPELIRLVETESFDVIGEIAIEGLGNLGDPSAVPVLTKVLNDQTRDKSTHELAKKALAKLPAAGTPTTVTPPVVTPVKPPVTPTVGTPPVTPPADGGTDAELLRPPVDGTDPAAATTAEPTTTAGGSLLGDREAVVVPTAPVLPDDVLAASDRLTIAAGTASLGYDTVRKRSAFDADVAGAYAHRIEREKLAYGWDAGAHVVAGYLNPPGRATTRGAQLTLSGDGEVRFYAGKLYGVGKGAVGVQVNYLSNLDDATPDQDIKDTRLNADLQIALGVGYGRILDVGGAIRVRRLSRALDAAHALGKPIDAATAKRLQLTWWSMRGERSLYGALTATVAILREAGILLGEPDAGLAYEILQVLRDSQLFQRPDGFDVQVAIGEGYLRRPDTMDGQSPRAGEAGRVEQLLAVAAYGKQLADDTLEISGGAHARLRLFAPDAPPQPSPWAVGAGGRVRRYTYGAHGDAFGALDATVDLALSDDDPLDNMDASIGLRITGQLGFTYWLNQASGIRLAGTLAEDSGRVFFGVNLEATYGLLGATFAGL